jgi:outer membrane protein assembly factor BamE
MLDHPCRSVPITLAAFVLAGLAGCSSFNNASTTAVSVVKPYKIDVVQGNVVTREQLAALRPGMPRTTVRDILGTALLTSVFHADRWDYVFTLKRQGAAPQSRKVTVYFKNDVVDHIDADELPSEVEFVSTLRTPVLTGPLPPLVASEKSLEKFPVEPTPAVGTSTPAPPSVAYPPLEPAQK